MLLKLSVRSAVSEFQIVGAAWQNAWLPKTVLAPASWSRQWLLEAGANNVIIMIIVPKMMNRCVGTVQMREVRKWDKKWEEVWFKTTAEGGEGDCNDMQFMTAADGGQP